MTHRLTGGVGVAVRRDAGDSGWPDPKDGGLFGRLFDQHAGELFGYLTRRVGRGLAEDLVADTFEVAMRQWEAFDPERGSARSWLYGIATNLMRRHARQEQLAARAMGRLAASHDASDTPATRGWPSGWTRPCGPDSSPRS